MTRRVRNIGKELEQWREKRKHLAAIRADGPLQYIIKEIKAYDKHQGTTTPISQNTEEQRLRTELALAKREIEALARIPSQSQRGGVHAGRTQGLVPVRTGRPDTTVH
jgi:hypothetical protein